MHLTFPAVSTVYCVDVRFGDFYIKTLSFPGEIVIHVPDYCVSNAYRIIFSQNYCRCFSLL